MPTINPLLIPRISAGNLFDQLTTNTSINIRWVTALDPVFFEAINRPIADVAVRQLIIAKTLDAINLRLSHQALFPFLIPAKVDVGTTEIELPGSWIWDLHASLPKKWENVRLAKIKRISGTNGVTSGFTGKLLRKQECRLSGWAGYVVHTTRWSLLSRGHQRWRWGRMF